MRVLNDDSDLMDEADYDGVIEVTAHTAAMAAQGQHHVVGA